MLITPPSHSSEPLALLLAALPRATLKESFPAQPKAIHPEPRPRPARLRFSCDPLCSQFPYSPSTRIAFGAELPGHLPLHLPLLPTWRLFCSVVASRPGIPRVPCKLSHAFVLKANQAERLWAGAFLPTAKLLSPWDLVSLLSAGQNVSFLAHLSHPMDVRRACPSPS